MPPLLEPQVWQAVRDGQERAGETRANLLRLVTVLVFYGVILTTDVARRWGGEPPLEPRQQVAFTALAAAGLGLVFTVTLCLQQPVVPGGLKYAATAADLLLVTAAAMLGSGPRSPLVAGYFLVLAWGALRGSLPLVRAATVGAVVGYAALLAHDRWWRDAAFSVPRQHQWIVLAALALTGVVLGQVLRSHALAVAAYVRLRERPEGAAP